ncbi:MAG: fibronectin type III domain-containing protein [Planctomycetota bacterium]|nr:fibronectin type III domain-containing protein [Planctomycetota bacterium]
MTRRLVISMLLICFLPVFVGSAAFGDAVKQTPWLGGVTANSVYACLEATNTTAATVDFGLTNAYGMSATTASPGGYTELTSGSNYVHNVKLIGLLPNTQYHYKVTQGASVSADYSFWTAPLAGTPAHWGFAADCRTYTATHNSVIAQVATHAPRMMVYGGDLCNDSQYSTWNSEWFLTGFIPSNQAALDAVSPFVNSPGNHEGWGNMTKAFTQSATGDPDYFSFDYGDSHILVLNYMVSDAVGSAQWNFAANDLANTDKKFKIVVDHSPAYCYGGHGNDAEMVAMTTGGPCPGRAQPLLPAQPGQRHTSHGDRLVRRPADNSLLWAIHGLHRGHGVLRNHRHHGGLPVPQDLSWRRHAP